MSDNIENVVNRQLEMEENVPQVETADTDTRNEQTLREDSSTKTIEERSFPQLIIFQGRSINIDTLSEANQQIKIRRKQLEKQVL